MKIYYFEVPMKPAGKERPRFAIGRTYMPAKYMKWKKDFLAHCMKSYHWNRNTPITSKLSISVRFYTKTGNMRPDLDNALGAIMDAIQGKIIDNDRQIRRIDHCGIEQDDCDRISFHLEELP
jgi:Holliday junction resolvase RusA-like endonuclease